MPLAVLYRPELKEYDFGPGHPFRGERYSAFAAFLKEKLPPDDHYRVLRADPAAQEELLLICDEDYIEFTTGYFSAVHRGLSYTGDFFHYQSGDNSPVGTPGDLEKAARVVIGQAKTACDLVQQGAFQKVVSIGGGLHHAKRRYGEGFCLYNDVAFCGMYLLQQCKLDRIVILDTDAHAGNGTSEYFYSDPRVLFIDLHQDPRTIYPGVGFVHEIGDGAGKGFNVNIPLPEYAGERSYRLAFEAVVEPLVREFQPQVIVRNGGSDPHFSDGLTTLGLAVAGFRMIGEKTRQLAEVCGGREIDLIASGYNRKVLPASWLALVAGLGGIRLEIPEPEPVPEKITRDPFFAETERVIESLRDYLKPYWACFR